MSDVGIAAVQITSPHCALQQVMSDVEVATAADNFILLHCAHSDVMSDICIAAEWQ